MSPKLNEMSDFKFAILVIIASAIVMLMINKIFNISFFQWNQNNNNNHQSTWTQQTWTTYTWIVSSWYICDWVENCLTDFSWNKVEIPDDPRTYIDYIKKNWKPGVDYFIIQPNPQPIIRSKDKDQNNSVMYNYFATNRPAVSLKKPVYWYIMFVTKTGIPDNRDLLLWINWSSKGQILRNNKLALPVFNENEYLYDFRALPLAIGTKDINTYIVSWKLVINWFVWESGNWIKEIWIVLKNK